MTKGASYHTPFMATFPRLAVIAPITIPAATPVYLPLWGTPEAVDEGVASVQVGNTVARISVGARGEYVGWASFHLELDFENLGAAANFSAIGRSGGNLNTGSAVVLSELMIPATQTQTANVATFRETRRFRITKEEVSAAIGTDHIDFALVVSHDAAGSRDISILNAYVDYKVEIPQWLL